MCDLNLRPGAARSADVLLVFFTPLNAQTADQIWLGEIVWSRFL